MPVTDCGFVHGQLQVAVERAIDVHIQLQKAIDGALTALRDDYSGYCRSCGREGGTNKHCYACAAIMHLTETS